MKVSVRGQLQERFQAKEDRGESLQPARRIVQDLTHIDMLPRSDLNSETRFGNLSPNYTWPFT